MKIYIPFNSNDFNNVFSTLSISPPNFYQVRDFGFGRFSTTKLNPFDDVLVGFNKPTFPRVQTDVDNGYPVNLLVDVDLSRKQKKEGIFYIRDTIYLFNGFEVLYRNEGERKEIEAKSLKSVETKFEDVAKRLAHVVSETDDVHWIDTDLQVEMFSGYERNEIKRSDLKPERQINKVVGALLGFIVGSQRNLPDELRLLNQLNKELKNCASLYVNRLGEANEKATKQQFFSVLEAIQTEFLKIQSFEEEIISNTDGNIDNDFVDQLKNLKLFGRSYFDLIISGLLSSRVKYDSFYLIVEKTKKVSNYSRNPNYLQSYIDRLNKSVKEIVVFIEDYISNHISESEFDSKMLEADFKKESFSFTGAKQFSNKENEYLSHTLNFLIEDDLFRNIDELQESKKEYVKDLGQHFKENIAAFTGSDERTYLTDLYKSFNQLTVSFDVNGTNLDTLKSIALLFTKGRDYMQYSDIVESSSIINKEIAYAIWGAAFGYAGLPKTITKSLFKNEDQTKQILSKINLFIEGVVDPIRNEISGGSLSINEKAEKGTFKATQVNESQEEFNPSKKNEPQTDYRRLETFLDEIQELLRGPEKDIFLNVIKDLYRKVEEETVLRGDLFDNPEAKKKKFSDALLKKSKGIKGIGEGTVNKVVETYETIHQ